jgi:ATP-dependent Lhr-like helicase
MSIDERFHPAVSSWLLEALGPPTAPQREGWPAILDGRHTLIAAPTGSGKTLAAFLGAIDDLVRRGLSGQLDREIHVVYVSPLKALSNDIEKNLRAPLAGISDKLAAMGLPPASISTMVRTGDTPASRRAAMTANPPHIFVTTPESLYIMLTSEGGRRALRTARTVIVDEIHALVQNKRGSHLALSLERLDALVRGEELRGEEEGQQPTGQRLQRIGLSATQRPIHEVARFLVGSGAVAADGTPDCAIVDAGHRRELDIAIEVPASPLETVMSGEVWGEVYDRLAQLIDQHRTTLVFVNTRRLAERLARQLSDRLGEDAVTSHHGSLAREHRLRAEQRLKEGSLKALVATASLELGIDIGEVDLVCQLGSTRSIATLLQRVGRSGHALGRIPRGRLFPLSRDELIEAIALVDSIRRGELDKLCIPEGPLDILAQQIVAASAASTWEEPALYELMRRAWPYRALTREAFDGVVRMLADGFATQRGRRSAHIHHDVVGARIRGRRGARLVAITSGGAIPDVADYDVMLEPTGAPVGSVNEDFAIESMAGDIFQLGNVSYRILRVEPGKVRVEDARGAPPTIPFWLGEAPARTEELSASLSRLRTQATQSKDAMRWLVEETGVEEAAALQAADYLVAAQKALGAIPTQDTLVLERFFDETGGMHLVVHAPFGSRLNRAWGLALRKCFCRRFNFELQAAASENAIVLSLGPTHSFPLEEVWTYLKRASARDILVQALLDAPMFALRWRWNATRALSVLRFRGGKKVAPQRQRMDADDLLTVCFPDQVACLENVAGAREIPDHPLVEQTIEDCLHEAMDIDGLERLLERMEAGQVNLVARDVTDPSPLAAEILNARPYAFLDDAPLEERRTQAVMSRRWLDPQTASDLGALDPEAIARVRAEAWPEVRDADELSDALSLLGFATPREASAWSDWFEELRAQGRAARANVGDVELWIAAERVAQLRAIHPDARLAPAIEPPARLRSSWERHEAVLELVRGRLEGIGPTTASQLAASMAVPVDDIELALISLETEGFVLRGRFTRDADREWCERRLLARIHRYTIGRLRREIEPVSPADFMRFLLRWQHAEPGARLRGVDGLRAVVDQLDGFEAAAGAWESDILPVRCEGYDPSWLDALCLSGHVAWARRGAGGGRSPVRATPIALMQRTNAPTWLAVVNERPRDGLSPEALAVLAHLSERGASFDADLARETGIAGLEAPLGELVAAGLITSDGFGGLRGLLSKARRPRHAGAGRWAELSLRSFADEDVFTIAWSLLRRWGVMCRRLIEREGALPPWRDILRAYRRLEARGDIRGGRFVAGFAGEQYALPEAVGLLRKMRRERPRGELTVVSAADPLNLVGLVTPGARVPAIAANRVVLLDGIPMAAREGGELRYLGSVDEPRRHEITERLAALPA